MQAVAYITQTANIRTQDAWDSYVQSASLDNGTQGWPASMDPALMTPAVDGQAQMPQTSSSSFNGSGGIFMGGSTPPGNIPI